MAFQDLDELLGARHKQLPIRGKQVTFPDRISAKSGTLLLRISQRAKNGEQDGDTIAAELMDEKTFDAVQIEILGRSPEEFIAEGYSGDEVAHIFKTLMVWHLYGQDSAERIWVSVGPTEPANRAARRAATKKAPSKAPATSSRSRASRAGSTTRG